MSLIAEVRVPTSTYPLGKFRSRYPSVRVEVERMVPTGGPIHHAWLEGEDREDVIEDLQDEDTLQDLVIVDEHPGRTLVRFEWHSTQTPLFELLEEADCTVATFRSVDDGWLLQLRFPDNEDMFSFFDAVDEHNIELEFLRTFEETHPAEDVAFGLTKTQAKTLSVAYEAGYFEIPRDVPLAELAEELGVSEHAVSERLRRGLANLLHSVGIDGPDDGESRD